MITIADHRIRMQYPELQDFMEWDRWPHPMALHHRWQIGETLWVLKEHGGKVEDKANASGILRDLIQDHEFAFACDELSRQTWTNLLGELAGLPSATRKYRWDPPFIFREINGKRTKKIELNPEAELPPNPLEAYASHLSKVREASVKREARKAAPESVEVSPRPVKVSGDPRPEPGEDVRRLREMLAPKPAPVPEPEPVPAPAMKAPPLVAVETPAQFVNDEATVVVPAERATLDESDPATQFIGYEKVEVDSAPFVVLPTPMSGLVDSLSAVGGRSLVDNARLLLALAGDMLTQAFVAESMSPTPDGDDDKVKERLAVALDEAQRLRKKIQQVETQKAQHESYARRTEAALRAERERADALEANVERLLRGEKAENTRALKGTQRLMAEKPRTPVGA